MPTPVFVHPSALCESSDVGPGTRIWAFAHVMDGASIGADSNICDHVFIENGVTLGRNVTVKNGVLLFTGVTVEDDVFLGPGCIFTNDLRPRAFIKKPPSEFLATEVRRGATVGAGATIVCGHTIGSFALVAAGSVVADDVPAHALVAGNPARSRGWVCECGERLDKDLSCKCGKSYRLISDREGLASLE
ncbi:MAG: N-acetyltransferase [Acidimicrobiaceae bacterium]|nr:N-acetyltransferase [Acidimicrobiaceae bacterium]